MRGASRLVGRDGEVRRLTDAVDRARGGRGGIVLVGGEAGIGKTSLIAEAAGGAPDLAVLTGAATQGGTAPYAALVAALRSRLRSQPDALAGCGPLAGHLAVLLPELGPPLSETDRPTLFEAVRCALAHLSADQPVLVVLDDLHWSDEATLELLSALAEPLAELAVLVAGAYRTDGLARDHGVRRLRHELRRAGALEELVLGPLDGESVAAVLGRALGGTPAPSLVQTVHDATQGTPFFVEELAAALLQAGAVRPGGHGLELVHHGEVPIPETVRDAVLIGAAELSDAGRAAAAAAAVAGETFDLDQVGALSSPEGVAELLERGLARERDLGTAAFRHALTRDALYAEVPWMRRRALHRALAEAGEATGAPSRELATHWLGARDSGRACASLLRAAAESEALLAFRDAAAAGRQALDLWPDGADDELREQALERYARCAELAGDPAEAARAWRELADLREGLGRATARRHLAIALELRGEREPALAARRLAAEGFAANDAPADAAAELLTLANQQRLSAHHGEAMALAARAREEADRAGRLDLRLRALGVEGMAQAKHTDHAGGVETVRGALAVALEHDLTTVAAELYQRLSVTLYEGADLARAEAALDTAMDLCQAAGDAGIEVACVTCMAYVLRERGEWVRAAEVCRGLIAAGRAAWVAEGLLGAIHAFDGRGSSARRMLTGALAAARQANHYNMTIDSTAALARVAVAEDAHDEARAHCRTVLEELDGSDDRHYAIGGLRWASSWAGTRGDGPLAHECTDALSRIASSTGHADALAALACAIGETALLEGDAPVAAEQLVHALELHRQLDMPFERAQVELRGGVALAAAGERDAAIERLSNAYRIAKRLGARPLAREAAGEISRLGESVSGRLGVRAAAEAEAAGLSRRELEVVRLVAVGRTNREIAEELFLSTRTVDMHVRNVLRKLSCRSRVEAAHRAGELGLLVA